MILQKVALLCLGLDFMDLLTMQWSLLPLLQSSSGKVSESKVTSESQGRGARGNRNSSSSHAAGMVWFDL